MIEHVFRRAQESGAQDVIVATDDSRIEEAVRGFGGEVVMTSVSHLSGTDRLAEVAQIKAWQDSDIIVNLQGDEPQMDPSLVRRVAKELSIDVSAGIATLATPISRKEDVFSPNIVKVITSKSGRALYFSRAPIPWVRGDFDDPDRSQPLKAVSAFRHLGIYAYRVGVLKKMTLLPVCPIEEVEVLEQLRALWEGIEIQVSIVDRAPAHGVDTEEDLLRVAATMA